MVLFILIFVIYKLTALLIVHQVGVISHEDILIGQYVCVAVEIALFIFFL